MSTKYKLSFDRGDILAYVIDKRTKDIVHTIHYLDNDDESPPDITVDDITTILTKEDLQHIARTLKLSRVETKVLKRALKNKNKESLNYKLREAYEVSLEHLKDKLKRELEFEEKHLKVIPAIGHKPVPYDRHIFIAGASNSGKSYLAADILRYDKRQRPITLISKLTNDPAYDDLIIHTSDEEETEDEEANESDGDGDEEDEVKEDNNKKKKKKKDKNRRIKQLIVNNESDILELPEKELLKTDKGHIFLFDDIATFRPMIADYIRRYQNDLLETARKCNISVISTSHALKNYSKTKVNLNESEYVALFPSSNLMLSNKFLKDNLGMLKNERERVISKASRNRYMIVKTSSPLLVIHEKGIILL